MNLLSFKSSNRLLEVESRTSHWMVRNNSDGRWSEQGIGAKIHVLCPHQDPASHNVLPILFVTEIIKKVKKPPPLCRPNVAPELAPMRCIQVMKECWGEAPERRPTFEEVFLKVSEQSSRFNPLFVLGRESCFIPLSEPLSNDRRSPRALLLPLLLGYFMVHDVWFTPCPEHRLHGTTMWGVK